MICLSFKLNYDVSLQGCSKDFALSMRTEQGTYLITEHADLCCKCRGLATKLVTAMFTQDSRDLGRPADSAVFVLVIFLPLRLQH